MIKDEDIDAALGFLRGQAQYAAEARATVKHLAEFLKTKRAQLKVMQSGLSNAAAEDAALSDPAYIEVLEGYKVAVERDAYFSFKREAAVATIDAWRTQQSNMRAEGRVG